MSVKNGIHFIVCPCRNGDILDFTHNAMSKVHYGHTTMSGISEIPSDRHQIREYASFLSNMI